jgi:hypothetical protein
MNMKNINTDTLNKSAGLFVLAVLCLAPRVEAQSDNYPESWVNPPRDRVEEKDFIESELAPLVSLGENGKLVYKPYTDQGDRILDFSQCGYQRSEEPIPDVTVVKTLRPPKDKAKSMGDMNYKVGPDSSKMIQEALDQVAGMEPNTNGFRGAVLLKKGTWYLRDTLRIRSGVVLRGEGDDEDGSVLIFTFPEGKDAGIELGAGNPGFSSYGYRSKITEAYVPSGSLTLTLENTGSFNVGDPVVVYKTTNEKWIEKLGLGERLRHIRGGKEGANKKPWKPQTYEHLRKITAIDGNTITLDMNLPQSIEAEYGGGYVQKAAQSKADSLCGVESIRVVSNYDEDETSSSKSANYGNLQNGIAVKCQNGWVRNCTVLHVAMAAVKMSGQFCTVRDCTSLEPVGPKTGGKRYTYYINDAALGNLIYNCYGGEGGRHNFVAGARVQGPNAFLKCTALKGGQSEPHHRWSTGILFDNITLEEKGNLAAINRGDSGTGHGWAGANMVFWNCAANNIVVFDPETEGENNFAIGYTGEKESNYSTQGVKYANTRSGYWGTPQEGVYYGYALMGNGYIESPGEPVKPESLFEQQLIDRIGKDKADAVLK